jgi:hypothetical protein
MVCPPSQGATVIVWSATFESPDEWELQGFNFALDFEWDPYFAPKITNGVLKMPNTQETGHLSQAVHSSTVAYGTWSFDWYISAGTSHEAYEVIFFIVNNYYPTEQSVESTTDMTGYVLSLTSNEEGVNPSAQYERAVMLSECLSTSKLFSLLAYHQFPSALEGLYHIDITRDITGEFNIYFDGEHLFKVIDNTTTTSEDFIFGSWNGDTIYDNLTVSNTVDIDPPPPTKTTTQDTTTTTTSESETASIEFGVLVLVLTFSAIYIRKRKR